jgi:hypothetical protein
MVRWLSNRLDGYGTFEGEALSQHDLPLWAKGVAAALLVISSWWLLQTDTLREVAGPGIAVLSLGVVSGSILLGMHVPVGLWPNGPWRARFSSSVIVIVALVFAAFFVLFDPGESLGDAYDPAMLLTTVIGVVAWGLAFTMVRQRPYIPWFAVAIGAALIPAAATVVRTALLDAPARLCLLTAVPVVDGTSCEAPAFQTFGFLVAAIAPAALLTVELTFRRLLIGQPERAGLLLVVIAAAAYGVWLALVAPVAPGIAMPWWLGAAAAVGAGALFVLSGSLLVSAVYTATTFAAYEALVRATPGGTALPELAQRWEYGTAIVLIGAVLAGIVYRRHGTLAGVH